MLTVEKTLTIVTDTNSFEVASLPPEIQQFIGIMDDWREREANAASELQMIQFSLAQAREVLGKAIAELQVPAETPSETTE